MKFKHLVSRLVPILLFLGGGMLHAGEPAPGIAAPSGPGWTLLSSNPKLTVYYRVKPGFPGKEYKAIGSIAAPNWAVEKVLEDAETYPQFMPYVTESKILVKDASGWTTYQRISAPFVSDRDYVIHVRVEATSSNAGTVYHRHWEAVPSQAMPEKSGVMRVKVIQGYWMLEPAGESTHATYSFYAEPVGSIPSRILNYVNQSAIPKIFAAIEKQAAKPKYREKPPSTVTPVSGRF